MTSNNERKRGEARVMRDQFKINNREIEEAVVKGLAEDGFDVEIVPDFVENMPDFKPGSGKTPPMTEGSTIKVYRKVISRA